MNAAAPPPPMSFDDRVRALSPLGFTQRQSVFLVLAALHSGYCLRRQYRTFAGIAQGKNTRRFFDRLIQDRFAERVACRADRGDIYHIAARKLYRAIDQEDNRNRRHASGALMARKVMLLDFALANPYAPWLVTEQDKVYYFARRLGIPEAVLPQRLYTSADGAESPTTRYFVQKLPIFTTSGQPDPGVSIPASRSGDAPQAEVVNFVYLALESSDTAFERFLADHAGLLARLPAWSIVAVAPVVASAALRTVREVFDRQVRASTPLAAASRSDLRWYFGVRQQVEGDDFSRLSVADIDRFRRLRTQLGSLASEAWYARWLAEGDAALSAAVAAPRARLTTHVLPYGYTQFGSMPGVA